ncbi:MAG: FmdB family transcriptional regulator [Chloroflexi bacterium]|nr:FmdB family transcriptional regulator [Chloroflexota bacterium]
MPIYTYECQSCSETLEKRQSFSDAPLATHDICGGPLRRVIHPAGIVFKGSGFYNTDYKNGSSAKPSDTSKTEDKNGSASPSGESTSNANGSSGSDSASSTKSDSAAPAKAAPVKAESTGTSASPST